SMEVQMTRMQREHRSRKTLYVGLAASVAAHAAVFALVSFTIEVPTAEPRITMLPPTADQPLVNPVAQSSAANAGVAAASSAAGGGGATAASPVPEVGAPVQHAAPPEALAAVV